MLSEPTSSNICGFKNQYTEKIWENAIRTNIIQYLWFQKSIYRENMRKCYQNQHHPISVVSKINIQRKYEKMLSKPTSSNICGFKNQYTEKIWENAIRTNIIQYLWFQKSIYRENMRKCYQNQHHPTSVVSKINIQRKYEKMLSEPTSSNICGFKNQYTEKIWENAIRTNIIQYLWFQKSIYRENMRKCYQNQHHPISVVSKINIQRKYEKMLSEPTSSNICGFKNQYTEKIWENAIKTNIIQYLWFQKSIYRENMRKCYQNQHHPISVVSKINIQRKYEKMLSKPTSSNICGFKNQYTEKIWENAIRTNIIQYLWFQKSIYRENMRKCYQNQHHPISVVSKINIQRKYEKMLSEPTSSNICGFKNQYTEKIWENAIKTNIIQYLWFPSVSSPSSRHLSAAGQSVWAPPSSSWPNDHYQNSSNKGVYYIVYIYIYRCIYIYTYYTQIYVVSYVYIYTFVSSPVVDSVLARSLALSLSLLISK